MILVLHAIGHVVVLIGIEADTGDGDKADAKVPAKLLVDTHGEAEAHAEAAALAAAVIHAGNHNGTGLGSETEAFLKVLPVHDTIQDTQGNGTALPSLPLQFKQGKIQNQKEESEVGR